MVFSSAVFLFYFLPTVILLYFLANKSLLLQNVILFFSSFIFYFWGEKEYTILVLASVFFNYIVGIGIVKLNKPWSTIILAVSIIANLSMLFYFKYFGFFLSNLLWFEGGDAAIAQASHIHLPLGISFFTFHGLTYVIDIYRKDAQVSYNPLNVGLYTLFFPQLVAGPIVRYKDIDTQLTARQINNSRIAVGIKRFITGFAKKILIANVVGGVADDIYKLNPDYMSPELLWLAALCYTLQIYFDFSGYSDMAIGLAKIFGFDFLENFNFPYSAKSIQDFWRRWHISLSTFFRDYLYIPLGGNRKGIFRTYLNLIIVFFLTGIWHGASWNFVIWGLYHGFFLILERLGLDKLFNRLPVIFRHLYTLFVVMVGWVIFRIEDFTLLKNVLKKMFLVHRDYTFVYSVGYFVSNYIGLVLLAGIICSFPTYLWLKKKITLPTNGIAYRLSADTIYLLVFVLSIAVMASSTFNPFIYFRF